MGPSRTFEAAVARLARIGALSAAERQELSNWWRDIQYMVPTLARRKQLRTVTNPARLKDAASRLKVARRACAGDVQEGLAAAIMNEMNADPRKQTGDQANAASMEVREFFSNLDRMIKLLEMHAKAIEKALRGFSRTPSIDKFYRRVVLQRIEDFWTNELGRPRGAALVDFAAVVFGELDMPHEKSSLQKELPAKKRKITKSQE